MITHKEIAQAAKELGIPVITPAGSYFITPEQLISLVNQLCQMKIERDGYILVKHSAADVQALAALRATTGGLTTIIDRLATDCSEAVGEQGD